MQAKTMKAEKGERWEKATWTPAYAVGNDAIDADHERLFALFNEFVGAVNDNRGDSEIQGVLAELLEYTDYHFDREERLMREFDYPDYAAHKAMHDSFVAQIHDVNSALDAGGEKGAFVLSVLGKWLTGHILSVDAKVGSWLKEHDAAKAA
jgi:hemerythrin